MHGRNRKSAVFPLRVSRKKIEYNLENIIDCIREHDPDVVTLQEVDESSVLSGSFNQFEFLNTRLNYPYAYFAPSCSITFFKKIIFVSGNGIFSKYPLENCESHQFDFSFPTDRMGFVMADVKLPRGNTTSVVSVHLVYLDWMRLNSQAHQLRFLEKVLRKRKYSVILAGDFNCDLLSRRSPLRNFIARTGLAVYQPEDTNQSTYPSWHPKKRIDWIFPSEGLEFTDCKTLGDKVSDHLAVFASFSVL